MLFKCLLFISSIENRALCIGFSRKGSKCNGVTPKTTIFLNSVLQGAKLKQHTYNSYSNRNLLFCKYADLMVPSMNDLNLFKKFFLNNCLENNVSFFFSFLFKICLHFCCVQCNKGSTCNQKAVCTFESRLSFPTYS